MLEKLLRLGRRIIPKKLFRMGQPVYHFLLVLAGALLYGFPARKLKVIGVTGTKGKSTVVELIAHILEEAGHTAALTGTVHFKIAGKEEKNLYHMSMPGRFFMQKFLRRAVRAGCDVVVVEITSEGAKFFRHFFMFLDALVFTNLSPEHIESHGSYEKYRDAKLSIARSLSRSHKPGRMLVANADDAEHERFFRAAPQVAHHTFSLHSAAPYSIDEYGITFMWRGAEIHSTLLGEFNLSNILAAATLTQQLGIDHDIITRAIQTFSGIRGRLEFVQKEPFAVVVDYAHTPDSLEKFYTIFKNKKNICVFGNNGGGRDTWKRTVMAGIAEKHCSHIILTNEGPYDEDPQKIVDEMAQGVNDKKKLSIELDRRLAIREAITRAQKGDHILITGKGTEPYIMFERGRKQPWDDATVAREELERARKENQP